MGSAHEADKNLRHAKVSQSPCQTRNNGNHAIRSCFAEQRHSTFNYLFAAFVQDGRCDFGARKEARYRLQECNRIVDTTSSRDGTNQNNHQGTNHNAALDKIGGANGKISANKRVEKYD